MNIKKSFYYLTPVLLAVLMFASNFLNTKLFSIELVNFTVWFILSAFAFSFGWLINKTLGWEHGGKIVFAVIVAATGVSVLMVIFFSDYFDINELLTESLILYSLRNILLGVMGFFGMATSEVITLQKEFEFQKQKKENFEAALNDTRTHANLIIDEAKIKSEKIIFEAEKDANTIVEKKKRIELQLKEYIQAEKELIKKYEAEEGN